MKKVVSYQANDGKLFAKQSDCIAHEAQIKLKNNLEKFAEQNFSSGMSTSNIVSIIIDNKEALLEILK